jgi:hypothetical protein
MKAGKLIIGSRKKNRRGNPEDLNHPPYKTYRQRIFLFISSLWFGTLFQSGASNLMAVGHSFAEEDAPVINKLIQLLDSTGVII